MATFYTDSGSFNLLQVTGSANISASSGIALQIKSSGSTIFSISGSNGEIFNISDVASSNLFSVSSGSLNLFSIDNTKAIRASGSVTITGSLNVTGGITGSLLGTASYATQALSSSYAVTASYVLNAVSASYATQALSSSYALSASHATSTAAIAGTTNYVSKFTSGTTIGNSLIFDNGTNVGIGNTLPNEKLELSVGNGVAGGLRINYASTATSEGMDITYLNTGNTVTSFDSRYNSNNAVMQFRMKTAATAVTAMTILGSGNVGIGVTSPSAKLHVSGSSVAALFQSATNEVPVSILHTSTAISTLGFSGAGSISEYHVRIGANAESFVAYTNNSEKRCEDVIKVDPAVWQGYRPRDGSLWHGHGALRDG